MLISYWSRKPGKFLDRETGEENTYIKFIGSVREWYETIVENILDDFYQIRKNTNKEAIYLLVSPDIETILQASVLYKPSSFCEDEEEEEYPTLAHRFKIIVTELIPRNEIHLCYDKDVLLGKVIVIDLNVI